MKTKPQLFWLHSHFLYWMGGTKYVFEVLKRLDANYDLTVIVENAEPYASKKYQEAGINLVSLGKPSTTSLWYWLTLPWQLRNTISRTRVLIHPGSLIVSSMFPMNLVAVACSSRILQLCFEPFAFFHDPDFQRGFPLGKRLLLRLLQIFYSGWDIRATKLAKQIITLNQVTQRTIKEIYGRDSTPVYTGIDTGHFRSHVSDAIRKQYLGKDIIIHSTDYTPVKGTDRMVRIFAQVKARHPSAHLLVTTTITNNNALHKYQDLARSLGVADSVEFLGFVDYDVLPQLYSLAKVLVQCSFSERSGTTSMALPVKEALACGTPAIRAPVTTEDVEDGVTGYLVDPRDETQMVQRTLELLALSPSRRAALARKARAKIVKLYTWDQTASRISRIIESV